jgi:Zn-finger nucleic acid-binding protein
MTTISAPTTIAVNSINPIQIQFGALCFGVKKEDDENNMVPVAPCQINIEGGNFVMGDDGHIMTKLRTALLQGGEDDELMAPQNISVSNQMQQTRKYYEEYDKLGCDLMDMWRRPVSPGRGFQTCPNCRIYIGESAHKSNSEFNLCPIRNLGEVGIRTDAQVAYDIQ